jgi:hypothetical protein
MFTILNRLRGTHAYFAKIIGIGLGAVVYLLTENYIAAVLMILSYIIGESFGWGKWVGALAYPYQITKDMKAEREGIYNGIFWLANKIRPMSESYHNHCYTALVIRGFYWWIPVFSVLWYFNIVALWYAIVASVILAFAFPESVILARDYNKEIPTIRFGFFSVNGIWEKSEIIYGFCMDLVLLGIILLSQIEGF